MQGFKPLVTIIIPVYNGQNFLAEAINSALAQSYDNLEVIVVNDGSTDNTEKIALSYGNKIRYFSKENGGTATALNLAIQKSKGEYISWLSHDDLYTADKIEKQLEILKCLKNKISIICSNWICFQQHYISQIYISYKNLLFYNSNQLSEKFHYYKATAISIPYKIIDKHAIISSVFGGYIYGCDLLIPRVLFDKVGYFNEKLQTTHDYDLWFRFIKSDTKFFLSDNFCVKSRKHNHQNSVTFKSILRKEEHVLYQKAAIMFYKDIIFMKNSYYKYIKRRLRHSKNFSLLFRIMIDRILIKIKLKSE